MCASQTSLGQSLGGLFWDAELGPEPRAVQIQCAVPESTRTAAGCWQWFLIDVQRRRTAGGSRVCYPTADLHY